MSGVDFVPQFPAKHDWIAAVAVAIPTRVAAELLPAGIVGKPIVHRFGWAASGNMVDRFDLRTLQDRRCRHFAPNKRPSGGETACR